MLLETTVDSRPAATPLAPAWARALIVAEREVDCSDIQSDYFNTRTTHTIALAWSRHTRDLFAELRKAAASADVTKHMGPGCDVYTVRVVLETDIPWTNGRGYYKGERSHWHQELDQDGRTFATQADADAFVAQASAPHDISFDGTIAQFAWRITRESIEHREKYSMGHGYYLKASGRYGSGWVVRKVSLPTSWTDIDGSRL
jgi:hypothetical protein